MKRPAPARAHRLLVERDGAPPPAREIASHLVSLFGSLAADDSRFGLLEVTSRDGAPRRISREDELWEELEAADAGPRFPHADMPVETVIENRQRNTVLSLAVRVRRHPRAQLPGTEIALSLQEWEPELDQPTLLWTFEQLARALGAGRGFVETAGRPAMPRGPFSRRYIGWLTLTGPHEVVPSVPPPSRVRTLGHGASIVIAAPELLGGSAAHEAVLRALVASIGPALSEPPEPAKARPRTPGEVPLSQIAAPVAPTLSPAPPPSSSPPVAEPPRPRQRASPSLSGTADVDAAMASLRTSMPLPFKEQPPASAPSAPKPVPRSKSPLTGTVDVGAAMAAMKSEASLPFAAREGAPALHPPVDLSAAARDASTLSTPLGQTPSSMSLEQYAALCAEMAVFPGRAREIAARYRITSEAAWSALHEAWQAWLARDHAVWQRFRQMESGYREWFSKQGKEP